jgi:hypothetical protein
LLKPSIAEGYFVSKHDVGWPELAGLLGAIVAEREMLQAFLARTHGVCVPKSSYKKMFERLEDQLGREKALDAVSEFVLASAPGHPSTLVEVERERARRLRITKAVSLAQVDFKALAQLRDTGRCEFSLSETLFDQEYPEHYDRRLENVRLTIVCRSAPREGLICQLRLLRSAVRLHPLVGGRGGNQELSVVDEDRATIVIGEEVRSETGLVVVEFSDERYLPFRGAGAISTWDLRVFTEDDSHVLEEVILHLLYTVQESIDPKDGHYSKAR